MVSDPVPEGGDNHSIEKRNRAGETISLHRRQRIACAFGFKGRLHMEQPKIYRDSFTVAYYECDAGKSIKLSYLLRRMQQIATDHHDLLGLEYRTLYEKHFVFLLSKLGLDIVRMPMAGERVEMATMAKPLRGPRFIRDCVFTDGEGRRLLRAETVWLLANPTEHRIYRPSALPYPIPEVDDGEPVLTPKGRLEPPSPLHILGSRPVRFSDIDSNHHVNNAVYADICCDFLPAQWLSQMQPRRFYLHFANEAYLGETLEISAASIPRGQVDSFLPGPLSGLEGGAVHGYYLVGEKAAQDGSHPGERQLGFEGVLIGETL